MKKILALFIASLMIFALVSCRNNDDGSTPPDESDVNISTDFEPTGKTLIVYFSKTNTTKTVAQTIQSLTDADIFRIERKEPYPEDYTRTTEIAKEEKEKNMRPELKTYLSKETVSGYDTIFVGFPIWWGTAPMAVLSFIDFYDLSGKTVYTFCTSGSSPISGSTDDIRSDAKGATVIEGRRFSSDDETAIKSWLDSLE